MSTKHTPEFKREAVALYHSEKRSYREVTSQLGISTSALQRWVTESKALPGSSGTTTGEVPDLAQYRKLQARVTELERENQFLKKVSAFFAKEQP